MWGLWGEAILQLVCFLVIRAEDSRGKIEMVSVEEQSVEPTEMARRGDNGKMTARVVQTWPGDLIPNRITVDEMFATPFRHLSEVREEL